MDQATLERARAAFEALDLDQENSEIARLDAEMASIAQAAERAQERITEISRSLAESRGPSGRDVADRLLEGVAVREAAAEGLSREDLESERLALQAAIRDLRRREDDARAAVSTIEYAAARKTANLAEPLFSAIEAQMIQAATVIRDGWAAAIAVGCATRGGAPLIDKLNQALNGVAGHDRLLLYSRSVDVPAEVVAALAVLGSKGRALRPALIATATHH